MSEQTKIIIGDCVESLKSMDDGIVQTCVTSPPYFGLRDYGVDGQIGLEKNPSDYVNKLVDVFREVKRVLRDDGTVWLNIGDSYSAVSSGNNGYKDGRRNRSERKAAGVVGGIRPKNLLGIPWRVAFALQDDGWYLRQDIIWHKPNPMPESVKDRCTKAHEYIFLFSKSPRYYFDSDSIKEPSKYPNDNRKARQKEETYKDMFSEIGQKLSAINPKNPKTYPFRNKRSVWTISTRPYKNAHFATFPIDLIEPCILAGSKPGDLVLDTFAGSGTVGQAALKHGRKSILCELNPDYERLILERVGKAA
ncbi:MAG: site-specific DNA-methyltransferase [Burkholderiales bacterium]|nr:site-specific DNA-methyltransferase [Burkholderiales bacterium]MCP5245710.1 site-specific DNA-methyltransferase [Burkholderiales bacterium]